MKCFRCRFEKMLHCYVGRGGAEGNFAGALTTKAKDVAITQCALLDFFPIYENAAALATIFDKVMVSLEQDSCGPARNTCIGEL